jgi:hypothetical protein
VRDLLFDAADVRFDMPRVYRAAFRKKKWPGDSLAGPLFFAKMGPRPREGDEADETSYSVIPAEAGTHPEYQDGLRLREGDEADKTSYSVIPVEAGTHPERWPPPARGRRNK